MIVELKAWLQNPLRLEGPLNAALAFQLTSPASGLQFSTGDPSKPHTWTGKVKYAVSICHYLRIYP